MKIERVDRQPKNSYKHRTTTHHESVCNEYIMSADVSEKKIKI